MGFWSKAINVVKDIGLSVVETANQQANDLRETKQKYEKMNDNELLKIIHSEGFLGKSKKERGVAFGILKNRGFSVEDINARKA